MACFLTSAGATAAEARLDAAAIIRDTMKMTCSEQQQTIVVWFPLEYWKASFADALTPVSPEEQARYLSVLRPYLFFIVIHSETGPSGAPHFEAEQAIRARLTLLDQQGTRYKPLAAEDYDADLDGFLTLMKPTLARAAGSFGQHCTICVFRAQTAKGAPIANLMQEGRFGMVLGENKLNWNLPLNSLVRAKTCPECNESLSAAFRFCPYDGTLLPTMAAATASTRPVTH